MRCVLVSCLVAFATAGCGGDGEDPPAAVLVIPASESPSFVEEIIRSPSDFDPPPDPCAGANTEELVAVALGSHGSPETYLPAAFADGEFAIDYETVAPSPVDAIHLSLDHDESLEPSITSVDGECPSTVSTETLLGAGMEEGVVSARLEASFEGVWARSGRVFMPVGSGTITLRTAQLEVAVEDGDDWYFLFEPAYGEARLMVVPADPTGAAFEARDVPADLGVAALVHFPRMQFDTATGVVYAPPGFALNWRTMVDAAYVVVFTEPGQERLATPRPLVGEGEAPARRTALLNGVALDEEQSVAWLAFGARSSRGEVEVPCSRSVTLLATGFSTGSLTAGDATLQLGPGQELTLPPLSCEPGTTSTTLGLELRSMNATHGLLVARLVEMDS